MMNTEPDPWQHSESRRRPTSREGFGKPRSLLELPDVGLPRATNGILVRARVVVCSLGCCEVGHDEARLWC